MKNVWELRALLMLYKCVYLGKEALIFLHYYITQTGIYRDELSPDLEYSED